MWIPARLCNNNNNSLSLESLVFRHYWRKAYSPVGCLKGRIQARISEFRPNFKGILEEELIMSQGDGDIHVPLRPATVMTSQVWLAACTGVASINPGLSGVEG